MNAKAKDYYIELGERLRFARIALGISEMRAADALLVTPMTYRKWERGDRHRYSHYGVLNFCKTLGVDIGWLVGGPRCGSQPRPRFRVIDGGLCDRALA